jgi:4-amino-4-deoxychorismate lyase
MYVYVNGEVAHSDEAKISIFDHGFMYGLGLFETFRIYDGHPFLLDDHFRRLRTSLKQLGIDWDMKQAEILGILDELLQKNQITNAYVRWNVSAGDEGLGLYTGSYQKPTTIVYMKPLPVTMKQEKQATILQLRRNTPEGQERLKSHHYLNNVLAKREIGDTVEIEGIFLSEEGYLAEGIVSNLFWVKNGVVYTPAVETGILNGVTRQFVLTVLRKEGIPYKEGYFQKEALCEADEAFITNSIQEIIALTACNGKTLSQANPITSWLQQMYREKRRLLFSRDEIERSLADE